MKVNVKGWKVRRDIPGKNINFISGTNSTYSLCTNSGVETIDLNESEIISVVLQVVFYK